MPYVQGAAVVDSTIFDVRHKTLLINFDRPLSAMSTLEGPRQNLTTIGNHYSPPQFWAVGHHMGLEAIREHILNVLNLSADRASLLITGADMDNLAVKKAAFQDMTVYALVTGGVKSNAVRMGRDEGLYYELGTINVIIMANVKLTPRAMTRAIISATEAKSAAMQDLDVRSSQNSLNWQATGTGTDNIIVVQGTGPEVDNAGGHSKLGELIARAVYDGVLEAVYRQNGLFAQRNIFQRLQERGLDLHGLLSESHCPCQGTLSQQVGDLQNLLLEPRYAGFLEASMALSDAWQRGLISDLDFYKDQSRHLAEEIAGCKIEDWTGLASSWPEMPPALALALESLMNGLIHRPARSVP